jgi:hypothetical protein
VRPDLLNRLLDRLTLNVVGVERLDRESGAGLEREVLEVERHDGWASLTTAAART